MAGGGDVAVFCGGVGEEERVAFVLCREEKRGVVLCCMRNFGNLNEGY
jgi:hypothetical protein